jgi:autotransporter adhesin
MNLPVKISRFLKIKFVTVLFVTASLAAYATLGDGGKKRLNSFGSGKTTIKSFSLRNNYNYRGNNFFSANKPAKFIMLNTVVTYQKGNATYIVPLKKKVLLDKIKFNPAQNKF